MQHQTIDARRSIKALIVQLPISARSSVLPPSVGEGKAASGELFAMRGLDHEGHRLSGGLMNIRTNIQCRTIALFAADDGAALPRWPFSN
jgi:hypothetical protein